MNESRSGFDYVALDGEAMAVVYGDFDGSIAPDVHTAITMGLEEGHRLVTVDLVDTSLIDEGGMAVLADVASQALSRDVSGALTIFDGAGAPHVITDIAEVRQIFEP